MENRDPIPISALQHWCYCPRQCGLIHMEQAIEENVHTLREQTARHRRWLGHGLKRVEHFIPLEWLASLAPISMRRKRHAVNMHALEPLSLGQDQKSTMFPVLPLDFFCQFY